jgi:hypothetical protein
LERFDDVVPHRICEVVWRGDNEIEWFDLFANKVIDPVELFLKVRVGFEVPGHDAS